MSAFLAGDLIHHLEDSSSMFQLDHEQSDLIDSSTGTESGRVSRSIEYSSSV